MTDELTLTLEDSAKEAITTIASLLASKAPGEAVERALGTQLYLLNKVTKENAKVYLEYQDGTKSELYLLDDK